MAPKPPAPDVRGNPGQSRAAPRSLGHATAKGPLRGLAGCGGFAGRGAALGGAFGRDGLARGGLARGRAAAAGRTVRLTRERLVRGRGPALALEGALDRSPTLG